MQLLWLDDLRHLVLRLKDQLLGVLLLLLGNNYLGLLLNILDEFLLVVFLLLHLLEVLLQVSDGLLQVGNLAPESQDSGVPLCPLTTNSRAILGKDTDS